MEKNKKTIEEKAYEQYLKKMGIEIGRGKSNKPIGIEIGVVKKSNV